MEAGEPAASDNTNPGNWATGIVGNTGCLVPDLWDYQLITTDRAVWSAIPAVGLKEA
jgi:hypothetical protein